MNNAHVLTRLRNHFFSEAHKTIITIGYGPKAITLTWENLLSRAAGTAEWLAEKKISPGTVIPVVRSLSSQLISDVLGCILYGAVPCILAPPNPRMRDDVFFAKLEGILGHFDLSATVMITDAEITKRMQVCDGKFQMENTAEMLMDPTRWLNIERDPDQVLFLQHSSGTSGIPKGVEITSRMLCEHLDAYGMALGVRTSDRIASWLPLYHDMGCIACLWGGLMWNIHTVHLDNFKWVLDPSILLRTIAAEQSTLVWMPNFAFALLTRTVTKPNIYDLTGVRLWTSCSEPVLASTWNNFQSHFATSGVQFTNMASCYGMAENVFAVTHVAHARQLTVDRCALEEEGKVVVVTLGSSTRTLVSNGKSIAGTTVGIAVNGTPTIIENQVGELILQGHYMLRHYYQRPEETTSALRNGWYFTGDMGFIHDGEVYIIGRCKDIIIVGGRNCDPTEIENVVSGIEGVVPGRVCCVGMDDHVSGTQEIHIIVETELATDQQVHLIEKVKNQVRSETDFQARQVWCVPPRWLVKSSSGKISRLENRKNILSLRGDH